MADDLKHAPSSTTPAFGGLGIISRTTQINLILLCLGFVVFALVLMTEFMTEIVGTLAGALILTYLLLGPVHLVERLLAPLGLRHRPRLRKTLAILGVYVLMLGVLAFTLVRVIPPLTLEIKDFAKHIPAHLTQLNTGGVDARSKIHPLLIPPPVVSTPATGEPIPDAATSIQTSPTPPPSVLLDDTRPSSLVRATTQAALQKLTDTYQQHISRVGTFLLNLGASTLASLVYILTTLVLVFYLLQDGRVLKEGIINLMPLHSEARMARFLNRLHCQLHSFLEGQILMSFLAGSLMYLLLAMLHIKYALMLAVFFGLASILPVIGPWIGLIPITAVIAATSQPIYMVQVLLFSGIFYLLKTYWLWPELVLRQYDIHPVIFILTFVLCLKLVGYLGILLSFPLSCVLSVMLASLRASHHDPDAPLPPTEQPPEVPGTTREPAP